MNAQRGGFIAGNWKNVNMTVTNTIAWVDSFNAMELSKISAANLHLVLFPPMSAASTLWQQLQKLPPTKKLIDNGVLHVGGQDVDPVEGDKVRVTGSHHPKLLIDVGMEYVLLGHSERRIHLEESDAIIAKKLILAIAYGLKPILCVGETLAEYEAKGTHDVLKRQLSILNSLPEEKRGDLVIAYEPVWAIGTGKTPTAEEANAICTFVRETSKVRLVIYGGSVTSANAADFFSQSDIDGALPGGASEKPQEFFGIATAAVNLL